MPIPSSRHKGMISACSSNNEWICYSVRRVDVPTKREGRTEAVIPMQVEETSQHMLLRLTSASLDQRLHSSW